MLVLDGEADIVCRASDDRALVFNTSLLTPKTSRATQGVGVMSLKAKRVVAGVQRLEESGIQNTARYRVRSLPAAGALLKPEDREEQQLSLLEE